MAAEGAELSAIDEAFVAAIRLSNAELAQQWSPQYLASLRLALPQMADAVLADSQAGRALRAAVAEAQRKCGTFIDPRDNWYTRNIARFGGGFDMKQLTAQPGLLAQKFDKLSNKYDQWTVGNGCTYYEWLASSARTAVELRAEDAVVLDVACGIGLPGHVLRLCGFKGRMSGTDISAGMLAQARERPVYDETFVCNANEGLSEVDDASVSLVVCMGAMELLDHGTVLKEFARVLKPTGRLWASFQWEGAVDDAGAAIACPTAHQNVSGVTLSQLVAELNSAGFDAATATIERSTCAFYTPSPNQDGSVLPVPYLYVSAELAPSRNASAGL